MRGLFSIVAAVAAFAGTTGAIPIITVHPGNKYDVVITKENTINATTTANGTSISARALDARAQLNITSENTLNATTPAPSNGTNITTHSFSAQTTQQLPLALVNNFGGGQINAYVTGLDPSNRLVMLQPDGTFYYPTSDPSQTTPQPINANVAIKLGGQGSTTHVTLPDYISAARVWFAEGDLHFYTVWSQGTNGPSLVEPSAVNPSDPSAAVNWGFVELTNNAAGGLYANISYVDFVGLVLGMSLLAGDGSTQTAQGLRPDAVSTICAQLSAQTAKDGMPWTDLCMADSSGKPLRVLAPIDYLSIDPSAFEHYFDAYIDQVWSHYATNTLTINTQVAAGEVTCKIQNNAFVCAGDNRSYAKPTAADIFGCNSGPFSILGSDNDVHRAVVPRLCAAFNRGTLMMEGGDLQPGLEAGSYYKSEPNNWYSYYVHESEVDGKGYAFSYDDVCPDGDVNQSGVVASGSPRVLTITVGGPGS